MHFQQQLSFVLSALLTTSNAFIPVDADSAPWSVDTELWSPLTTITLPPATSPTLTPAATATQPLQPQRKIYPAEEELKVRQVAGQGEPVAATALTQMPPVTTYYVNEYKATGVVEVQVVYTQLFSAIPDQWPSATSGEIGLGTIQGTIGVVKSKRGLPTQEAMLSSGARMESGIEEEKAVVEGEKVEGENASPRPPIVEGDNGNVRKADVAQRSSGARAATSGLAVTAGAIVLGVTCLLAV